MKGTKRVRLVCAFLVLAMVLAGVCYVGSRTVMRERTAAETAGQADAARKAAVKEAVKTTRISAKELEGEPIVKKKVTVEETERILEEKQKELSENANAYSRDSIVVTGSTLTQLKSMAAAIGADLRMLGDASYGVLYLPEGVTVEDVYAREEYAPFLEAMSLDRHVSMASIVEEDIHTEEIPQSNTKENHILPDYEVNDSDYTMQEYLKYMNLSDVWNDTRGAGVRIAVIDSGERVIIMSS